MAIVHATDITFDNDIQAPLVLVDFWAEWCNPCRALAPVLDQIDADYGGKVKIIKVDVDKYQDLTRKYGVMNIPNVQLFADGVKVDGFAGFRQKAQIKQLIDRYIGG